MFTQTLLLNIAKCFAMLQAVMLARGPLEPVSADDRLVVKVSGVIEVCRGSVPSQGPVRVVSRRAYAIRWIEGFSPRFAAHYRALDGVRGKTQGACLVNPLSRIAGRPITSTGIRGQHGTE